MKVAVSILIPIKNEAANLPRCLESVAWADEVFVIDSNSSDGSQRIAGDYGAHVVQFPFNGTWPKKKNWALENLPFKHDWVFILDADEVLPPETEEEIRAIVSDDSCSADLQSAVSPTCSRQCVEIVETLENSSLQQVENLRYSRLQVCATRPVGYWINRRFMFMGKWLKHAYYPNWNLRLFKHRLGRYEKLTDVNTASGDNEVHEHVIVDGATGYLRSEMDHYAFPSVDVFVEKHNRYSNWEARVALDHFLRGSQVVLQSGTVGWRRKLKSASQRLPFRPLLRFLYVYLWQRGFLDGREGYYFARLHGFYEFLSVAK
ncbi:MAG TPA: glycosyltransferase family 2 protein, partial [Methylomirabilota bacterium]|nr:glycosyltransferase family 2 protein [Methylomirabilota bacterium]